jgi:hypothetical protein
MEKIVLFTTELLIATGLLLSVLNFWRRQIQKAYFLENTNRAYAMFVAAQCVALLLILLEAVDPQGLVYMETLTPFGGNPSDFWAYYGFQTVGLLVTYIVAVLLAQAALRSALTTIKGLYKEISEDNCPPALIAGTLTIVFGTVLSNVVLRPLLLDLVSRNAGFVPLQ